MDKTILGIDIGHDTLKLALCRGKNVKKTAIVTIPEQLVKNGRIISNESMAELLRTTIKANGMRCSNAAVCFPNENVYTKNVTMPIMNTEQLEYNLPYEFRDYITDELKNYVFDYAMITTVDEIKERLSDDSTDNDDQHEPGDFEAPSSRQMELIAAAAPVEFIEMYKDVCRKAGLRLIKGAPSITPLRTLIRANSDKYQDEAFSNEYCFLDLGYRAIRMYMFKGESHNVTRVLDIGLSNLDEVIADSYNVDIHLAHTYLLNNHEDCQTSEACMNAYTQIAVELMRALNFYQFNNPESRLDDIWVCGGGAAIPALIEAISNQINQKLHNVREMIPGGDSIDNCYSLALAVGIAME